MALTDLGEFSKNRPILFVGHDIGNGKRKYQFASAEYRNNVDLTEYKKLIKQTIRSVKPDIKVKVETDGYVLAKNAITDGEARTIGKKMAKTELRRFLYDRNVLFEGKTI